MFPDEQTAMAWGTLTELKAFLSVSDGVLQALENKFVLVKPAWSTGIAIVPKPDPKADSSGASGASPPPIEEDMDEVDDDSMVLAVPAQGEGPNSKLPLIQSTRTRSGRGRAEPETPGAVTNIDKELAEKEAKIAKLHEEVSDSR